MILEISIVTVNLKSEDVEYNEKIFVIEELIKKFKINRYITEYFSEYASSNSSNFSFSICPPIII